MLRDTAQVEGPLTVHTEFQLFQTTYKAVRTMELEGLNLPSQGWFRASLRQWAKNTEFSPASKSDVDALATMLHLLKDTPEWVNLVSTSIEKISRQDILALYSKIEDLLIESTDLLKSPARIFDNFRSIFRRFIEQQNSTLASSVKRYYRPKLKATSTPRPLISHMPLRTKDGKPRHPIDAIPHKSLKELAEKQSHLIISDINIIRSACEEELSNFNTANKTLENFFKDKINPSLISNIAKKASQGTLKSHQNGKKSASHQDLIDLGAAYWHLYISGQHSIKTGKIDTPHTSRIEHEIQLEGINLPARRGGIYRFCLFGDSNTRIAALYILQLHTGWNASSVVNLTTNSVIGEAPPYQIQAFKSRTEKDTPVVLIEKTDKLECIALEFLLKRLESMKRMGIASEKENRLWLSAVPLERNENNPKTMVAFISDSRRFQLRHSLPLFSLEQIRVQTLARQHTSNLSIEGARLIAGHANIDTTAHYLDQELIKARSSAINLEYQRVLEASVKYEVLRKSENKKTDRTQSILYPIGDGSSCIDPYNPPKDFLLKDGICAGHACHQADGCTNRRILINVERIIENYQQVRFYKEHWKVIADQYPEKFRSLHLPSMLFSMALDEIIKKGPMAAVRLQIVMQLQNKPNESTT